MKAIIDMNMPKLVSEDIPLFMALFNDLFPEAEISESGNKIL